MELIQLTMSFVLEDNRIKLMNSDVFGKLSNLKHLHLSGNECVDEDFDDTTIASAVQIVHQNCGFREGNKTDNVFNFECGKVSYNEGYVVGGRKVIRGQWPFIVALRFIRTKQFFCGGVLITTTHVVTGNYHQEAF